MQTHMNTHTGVTFSETWSTNAQIDTELNYEPCGVDGLKLTLSSSFLPSSGYVVDTRITAKASLHA